MEKYIILLLKKELYENLNLLSDNYDFSKEEYHQIINKYIDKYTSDIKIDFNINYNNININKNLCMARIWKDGKGGQCSCKKKRNDYCNTHMNMILKYNKLRFNRIDQEKPIYDQLKLEKERVLLNWKT